MYKFFLVCACHATLKRAIELGVDYADMPDTHWFYDVHSGTTTTYTQVQWDKKVVRQVVDPLNICQLFIPEHLKTFVRDAGRVEIIEKQKPSRNVPQHLIVRSLGLDQESYHYLCFAKNWPCETPGHIYFAFNCPSCKIKNFLKKENIKEVLGLGLETMIKVLLAGLTSDTIVFEREIRAKPTVRDQLNRKLVRNAKFLLNSPTFLKCMNGELAISNYIPTVVVEELMSSCESNVESFTYMFRQIPSLSTLKPIANDGNLLHEIIKYGQLTKMYEVSKTMLINEFITETDPPECSFDMEQTQSETSQNNTQCSPSQSISSCPFDALSGSETGSPVSNQTEQNAQNIRAIGLRIPTSGFNPNKPLDLDVYKTVRRQCLKNFLDHSYFFTEGDMTIPEINDIQVLPEALQALDSKLIRNESYFDALNLELTALQAEHVRYQRKLQARQVNISFDANSIPARDSEKITERIVKLHSLETKISESKKVMLEKVSKIRNTMIARDLEKFQNLKFCVMDPLETYYQALFYFMKRTCPLNNGVISDTDFPKESELTTGFGLSYRRFYENTCKATVVGISQLLRKCKDLFDHFDAFNENTELILQNDESPENKASELMKLIQTYGGHTHIVQDRANFNEFSIFRTGKISDPVTIPTQVSDNTRRFLTVPLETPTPKVRRRRPKRSASVSESSRTSLETPKRSQMRSPIIRSIFNKKSRFDQ